MKKYFEASEITISGLQWTVETLNTEVNSLEKENSRLKNNSILSNHLGQDDGV